MQLRYTLGALASVLFPAPCRICGEALTNASRIPICEPCLAGFEKIAAPLCECCGRPFPALAAGDAIHPLCRLCRMSFYAFDRARSFAIYDDPLVEAIMLLKYEEVPRLGHWFAKRIEEIARAAPEEWQDIDMVVPVPLHADRRRERGHNQAEQIARPLAKSLGLKLAAPLLVRVKPRPAQLVLSRSERWKAVRGAYVARDDADLKDATILLVDDVMTTGATLDSCARALKKAGAKRVLALTVGRARLGGAAAAGSPVQRAAERNVRQTEATKTHL
jgi:ComF family protein